MSLRGTVILTPKFSYFVRLPGRFSLGANSTKVTLKNKRAATRVQFYCKPAGPVSTFMTSFIFRDCLYAIFINLRRRECRKIFKSFVNFIIIIIFWIYTIIIMINFAIRSLSMKLTKLQCTILWNKKKASSSGEIWEKIWTRRSKEM